MSESEGFCSNLMYYPSICLEGMRKASASLRQDSQYRDRDSKSAPT